MRIDAKRFSKIMRDMARVSSQASAKVAKDLNREIQRNFDKGVDPYGRKWKGLAQSTIERGRHNPPLTDTRQGRRSVIAAPLAGAGIRITVGILYMIYHQFGGASHLRGPGGSYRLRSLNKKFGRDADRSAGRKNPPKRSFLPFDKMPATWLAIWQRALDKAARNALRGVARG